jgi:hypothetical protein
MNQKLLDYSRAVAAAANQDRLDAGHAILFCKEALPLLLAEVDVVDLLSQRFDALLAQPDKDPVEAPARKRSRPAKKPRRRKGGRA